MAVRRPIVLINGRRRELPVGDTIPPDSYAPAPSLRLPFFLTDGTSAPIPLTSNYSLPFYLTTGARADIPTVTA